MVDSLTDSFWPQPGRSKQATSQSQSYFSNHWESLQSESGSLDRSEVPSEAFSLTDALMFVFIASLHCILSSPAFSAHATVNDWKLDADGQLFSHDALCVTHEHTLKHRLSA